MSLLRGLAVFILSSIFIFAIFTAITSYTLGSLIQKDSIKAFIKSESLNVIDKQCQDQCSQYADYKDACIQICSNELTNQTQTGVDNAVNTVYQQKFFGATLDQISSLLSQYVLFLMIGVFLGALLLVVSQTKLLTFGKNFITLAVSLFISSFTPQFIIAVINLPFNLGEAIKNYLSSGFNQQLQYAIILLIAGVILIIIDYSLDRRKKKK